MSPIFYAIAAEQILRKMKIDARPAVVESGYYFPTRKGEGNKIIGEFDRERFKALVAELVGILEKGHFVSNPGLNEVDCTDYCDYSAKDRAKGKKEKNPDVFGIFERLKDYQ